jgi:hypothetical protein
VRRTARCNSHRVESNRAVIRSVPGNCGVRVHSGWTVERGAFNGAGGTCQSSGIQFFSVSDMDYLELYRRGIRLVTGRANARDDMPAVLALMAQGRFDPSAVTGNVIAFEPCRRTAGASAHA